VEYQYACALCYIESEISVEQDDDVIIPEPAFCPFCGHGDIMIETDELEDV